MLLECQWRVCRKESDDARTSAADVVASGQPTRWAVTGENRWDDGMSRDVRASRCSGVQKDGTGDESSAEVVGLPSHRCVQGVCVCVVCVCERAWRCVQGDEQRRRPAGMQRSKSECVETQALRCRSEQRAGGFTLYAWILCAFSSSLFTQAGLGVDGSSISLSPRNSPKVAPFSWSVCADCVSPFLESLFLFIFPKKTKAVKPQPAWGKRTRNKKGPILRLSVQPLAGGRVCAK